MSKYESNSKYCYPGTNVLINNFNIKDQKTLEKIEVAYTTKRQLELQFKPIRGSFNLPHLQEIHRFIFQDVFPFAGEIRTENISKGNFRFAEMRFIEPAAADLFEQLKNDDHLVGLSFSEFCNKAAKYMAEINVLHPFREGNGRTQREFIRTLAVRNGFELDWSREEKPKIYEASLRSVFDISSLGKVIENTIENKEPIISLKKKYLNPNERGLER